MTPENCLFQQEKSVLAPYVDSILPLEQWKESFRLAAGGKGHKMLFQISEE